MLINTLDLMIINLYVNMTSFVESDTCLMDVQKNHVRQSTKSMQYYNIKSIFDTK